MVIPMERKESFLGLYHGTDEVSAKIIKENGFELSKAEGNWCGCGVYFYDVKDKAWWAAKRKCEQIKKERRIKLKSSVVVADIIDVPKSDIFDLRSKSNLDEFEKTIRPILNGVSLSLHDDTNEEERIIKLRSALIQFFADKHNKKIVVGHFKQRYQPEYLHTKIFTDKLDIVFGIETIYCVKDKNLIEIKAIL